MYFTFAFAGSSCSSVFLSAVTGGGWAGLSIDKGVLDTSKASKGGSGALANKEDKTNEVMNSIIFAQ